MLKKVVNIYHPKKVVTYLITWISKILGTVVKIDNNFIGVD